MEEQAVLVEHDAGVRTLRLNRPKALNSFTGAMHGELRAALDAAADDAEVRCVVLTGSGRGFCAGQDLADPAVAPNLEPGGKPTDVGAAIERYYKPLALRVRSMPVPVVAAVNGVAAGAGANLALVLRPRASPARSASFIQAFAKIGLIPDCGGTWLLPRLVGRANALALAMLGDKLAADDAERIGLIWKCVDDAAFEAEVRALADAPRRDADAGAGRDAQRASTRRSGLDLGAALSHEADVQRDARRAHDYLEGVAAFMAKRAGRLHRSLRRMSCVAVASPAIRPRSREHMFADRPRVARPRHAHRSTSARARRR